MITLIRLNVDCDGTVFLGGILTTVVTVSCIVQGKQIIFLFFKNVLIFVSVIYCKHE